MGFELNRNQLHNFKGLMAEENISMNFQYGIQSLHYYFKQGKLTQTEYNAIQEAFKNIRNVIDKVVKNYNKLHNIANVLKKECNAAKYELEAATSRQSQASDTAQKLSRLVKTAQVAFQSQKTSYDSLVFESEELEKDILNRNQRIKEEMRQAEERMQPRRDRYRSEIEETKQSNVKAQAQIQSLQQTLEGNMLKINSLRGKNQESQQLLRKLTEEKLKIIDEPEHYFKSGQNLRIEIQGMEAQLKQTHEQIERKQKVCKTNQAKRLNQVEQQQEIEKQRLSEVDTCEAIETEIEKLKNMNHSLQAERTSDKIQMMELQHASDQLDRTVKNQEQKVNKLKKQIQRHRKHYRKQQHQKKSHEDQIRQYEIMIQKLRKQQADIHSELRWQSDKTGEIKNQLLITENKINQVKDKIVSSEGQYKQTVSTIDHNQRQLQQLKKNVAATQKRVHDLTAQRQSMARRASAANSLVRQTREQLKVKELLIKDLTKKHEQTYNKLQHFKALYEEVKSARNKYVNLIHNSSQDKAEYKERIKILENQLQILKNESAEKGRTILEYGRMFQLQKHNRDQMKAKLNKLEYENKQKMAMVDQNIKQTQKLNMVILSLQTDMQRLRNSYEQVCQNRNYTGIQLIDRNDELCILYQKSNMQEKVLRQAQLSVKALEDDIRMINIQIAETQRKIKVARDKTLVVPQLAQKILQLQQLYEMEVQKEHKLSHELQNPDNDKRFRELQGQDPDEQALDAKISVLEQRLNSKKQQLLQKQLILDQITNLTDKLRHQAFDGRQSTLEVSEKINEFQSRLKQLTRKMKATISELSMSQANAIKYKQERQNLQQLVESAKKRMEEGLPPTQETEIEYLKMMRDKKRYQQQKQIRQRNELIERSYPPFATKTTAEHRVNAYIPDEIGLPKPYGRLAPFKPSDKGSNMRHFRKPLNKQIQI